MMGVKSKQTACHWLLHVVIMSVLSATAVRRHYIKVSPIELVFCYIRGKLKLITLVQINTDAGRQRTVTYMPDDKLHLGRI